MKLFEKEQNRKLNRIALLDFIFADPKKQKQRSIYQNKFSVVIRISRSIIAKAKNGFFR